MAKNIGYLIQPNATPTAAQAPYLVRLVPTGVANDTDLVADLSAEMPVTPARYATIWREALVCAIPRLKAGETVDLGCFRLVPHIERAMACEDSAFDPETNALVVAVYLIGELAAATEGLVPAKISSAALASLVKVSNVMDVATEAFSVIRGSDEFAVLGNGVTLDGEDEYVKALDAKTGEEIAVATVVRVSKGQRGFAKFDAPLPAGRTTVEIGTHGLVADEQLHVFKKTVTVLAGTATPPTDGGPTRPKAKLTAATVREDGDTCMAELAVENAEAFAGYDDSEAPDRMLPAKVSVNGGGERSVTFVCEGSNGLFLAELSDVSAGDTVRIRVELDPAMADRYAPGTTELTVVAG